MTKATKKLGPCQVGSKTDGPCSGRAVMEICGVPFCEPCAREQEAYFAIGELPMQEAQVLAPDRDLRGVSPKRVSTRGGMTAEARV